MGQKVHPYGFRLGYNKDWHSHWFAKKLYGAYLLEDLKLKAQMKGRFAGAGVSHVDVERAANRLKLLIYTSRPGIIIGRKGAAPKAASKAAPKRAPKKAEAAPAGTSQAAESASEGSEA